MVIEDDEKFKEASEQFDKDVDNFLKENFDITKTEFDEIFNNFVKGTEA